MAEQKADYSVVNLAEKKVAWLVCKMADERVDNWVVCLVQRKVEYLV